MASYGSQRQEEVATSGSRLGLARRGGARQRGDGGRAGCGCGAIVVEWVEDKEGSSGDGRSSARSAMAGARERTRQSEREGSE